MTTHLVWQQNSSNAHNADNLKAIAKWWSSLEGKEVSWQQRLVSQNGDLTSIDWKPQKFDAKFMMQTPQLRGVTIYWRDNKVADERNITASKLQLDVTQQKLYICPQSQSQVVICVSLPQVVYQKFNLTNPQIAATTKGNSYLLLLRDEEQRLEITATLDLQKLNQLLERLKTTDN
jgi:hypothetical protein